MILLLFWNSISAQQVVPTIDISGQKERQVIIASGAEDIYQGHPTTVLMPDEKTIYCVWTFGHGGVCGPMAKSSDGGKSWTQIVTPKDWSTMKNCPSLYLMADHTGKQRLMIYASEPLMAQVCSEDYGETWTSVKSLGIPCVMAFTSMVRLKNGNYLAMYNCRPEGITGPPQNEVWQAISEDGGLSWGKTKLIIPNTMDNIPCEPCVFDSPDRKELACLIRDNKRDGHSLLIFSLDEGETWSEVKEAPWGPTGDRHVVKYAPDGRMVVAFRDMAPFSPTRGHFVIWVGNYNDLKKQSGGQYKVKLLHSYAGSDCGYPGLEVLPDGTFVATTYIKYEEGNKKHSVVSVRFKLEETDKILGYAK